MNKNFSFADFSGSHNVSLTHFVDIDCASHVSMLNSLLSIFGSPEGSVLNNGSEGGCMLDPSECLCAMENGLRSRYDDQQQKTKGNNQRG